MRLLELALDLVYLALKFIVTRYLQSGDRLNPQMLLGGVCG